MKFDYPDGATPIDEDELVDLIPKSTHSLYKEQRFKRIGTQIRDDFC